jgi:hypothetical protein
MEPIWRDETLIESWLPIEGFEEYQVSDFGRVKRDGMLLIPWLNKNYKIVGLWKNGVKINKEIHRILALAFLPNPENKPTVNHLNEITYDNCLENLVWATQSEQSLWSPRSGDASVIRNIVFTKHNTYRVRICRNKKEMYSKSFALLEDARKARDEFLKSL